MYVIESRLHADNRYVRHAGRGMRGAHAPHSVLVRGTRGKLPVRSTVSAEDYAWLRDEPTFKTHVTNGSLLVHPPALAAPVEEEQPAAGPAAPPSADTTPGDSGEGTETDASAAPPAEDSGEKAAAKEMAKAGAGKKAK